MAKYIVKRDAQGNRKKVNIFLSESHEENGMYVSKINPDIYLSYGNQTFDEELSGAIALFEKNLNFRESKVLIES